MTRNRIKRATATSIEVPAPAELVVRVFNVGAEEFALFEFPSVELRPPEGLSSAEREVVHNVILGKSNAEIGRDRGTSPRTVANQLRSIYVKLGVSGRRELVRACRTAEPRRV